MSGSVMTTSDPRGSGESTCLCEVRPTLVYSCSGGSNGGQIANEVAKSLSALKSVKMACLAGIGGGISTFVESAESAERLIVIDGCPVACARKTMERAMLEKFTHYVITAYGIKKDYELVTDRKSLEFVLREISKELGLDL